MSRYTDPAPAQAEFSVTSPPSFQLLTASELRQHLRLPSFPGDTDAEEDSYLMSLIAAAGESIESTVRRPIRDQQRELVICRREADSGWHFDGWHWDADGAIVLDITPIRSVDSVSYRENGETRTQAQTARVVTGLGESITRRVEIRPAHGESWPWSRWTWEDDDTDIRIAVTCGYETADSVPAPIKHACRIIAGDLYNYRGESVTGTIVSALPRSAKYLLQQFERMGV